MYIYIIYGLSVGKSALSARLALWKYICCSLSICVLKKSKVFLLLLLVARTFLRRWFCASTSTLLAPLSQIAHCRPCARLYHCAREFDIIVLFLFFIFIYFFLFFEKSKNTLVSFDLVLLFVLKRSLCIWVFSWVFHIRGTPSRIDRPRIIISPHYPSIFLSQFGC